jgi:hypothetical protein
MAPRTRVVVAQFGTRRVVCSDGTVWVDLSDDEKDEEGLTRWRQVKHPIPDAETPTTRKKRGTT